MWELTDTFPWKSNRIKGFKVLSTLLFNEAGTIRRANVQLLRALVNSLDQILASSDDIDIVCRTKASVHDTYSALREEAVKLGLDWRLGFWSSRRICLPTLMIPTYSDIAQEIKCPIMLGNRWFYGLSNYLRSSSQNIQNQR